ncbi:MAG: DNA polymerase III subunit alpha [Candidatus Peribacteraceae bacterium]|nr:DNA polymerase III subunit alpha [Candidatus Peribacteraceae bacterium]
MQASDFVHLHCHSTYSLLEGLPSPEEIAERAKELGHNAVGLADKGYTYGLIEFYKGCTSLGLKPLLGLETYVAARTRLDKDSAQDTRRYPLTLLAETDEGYKNLLKLATKAALEGMYYKPRVDAALLQEFGKGLIALSGPISGAIPQAALNEDAERLALLVQQYQSYFGKDNLYFELMDLPNVPGQAEVNQQLIKFGKELGVSIVATCNSHYCRREDAEAHDVLLCIQKNSQVGDTGRFTMRDSDFSMRPFEEMEKAFCHVPEALENTRVIADRCSVKIPFGTYKIPNFPVEKGQTEAAMLKEKCEEGMKKKYGQAMSDERLAMSPATQSPKPKAQSATVIRTRLDYELGVIEKMGFSGYFLIVADFIAEAKRRGITVGPGRGSAAGSIVSYVMDITTLDPLAHGLLFERFLNPERKELPDIDVDFADTRRDEILDYVRGKYGSDRVIQICTFGTLAARAAVKDVGRAYGVSFAEMNALAKAIPDRPGTLLKDALETDELRDALQGNETYKKIVEVALKLEGKSRHVSVHACGVVITPEPAVAYTALQRAPKNEDIIITQYDAKPLAALGLVKMDFLGLKNLTIIQTALLIIERTHNVKINMSTVPTDDRPTFEVLSRGDTTGVFQFESPGMKRYLKKLKPTRFEDLIAMVALYRPGPMENIPLYISNKEHPEKIEYPHPILEQHLKETYGVAVYQEQIQQIAQSFAGMSLGQGYVLIKAVAKKIPKLLEEQKTLFLSGAVAKGHSKQEAAKLFATIEPFAGYGFNKSHAACYARIAYETAYLKAHYPTEFMAALLSSEGGDTDRISIEIEETRAMGIKVLPPDINESLAHFTALPESTIRFGLLGIKGVGESSIRQMIEIREKAGKFASIEDFATRVPAKILNKKLLESLAKAGAFDSLGERGVFVAQFDRIAELAKTTGDVGASQTDMFSSLGSEHASMKLSFDPMEPASNGQKLRWEKETLGLYVSSHPLAGLKKYMGKKARLIEGLCDDDVGKKITVAGIVEATKIIHTKKGETMAALTIEDPTGRMEVMLFPRVYAQFKDIIDKPDSVLVMGGSLDMRMGLPQLKVEAMKRASIDTMITKAKEAGMFNEEESKNWRGTARRKEAEDVVEQVTEEGEIVHEHIEKPEETRAPEIHGPLAKWIFDGMNVREPLEKLRLDETVNDQGSEQRTANSEQRSENASIIPHSISIHTISLPARAPKELMIEIRRIFETFPGSEKVQLKIGERMISVPLTITMSPILEKRVEEAVKKFSM